jgi:4-hydroxybenzoyl-CoA reductase subunit beta
LFRLSELERDGSIERAWPALARAASLVATPPVRNLATVGGNLCLDTRCSYYNQGPEWRQAVGYCLKKDGDVCWVAPGSSRCWAVSSSDTAPVLCALGARLTLVSSAGERSVEASELFADDGIRHLTRRPDEILTLIHVPAPLDGERSVYVKLRRRGSFDFPVLGIAARLRLDAASRVSSASIFVGGTGSRPQPASAAAEFLVGQRLDERVIDEAARIIARCAKPLQNTDFSLGWRKAMAPRCAARALDELRRSGPSRASS